MLPDKPLKSTTSPRDKSFTHLKPREAQAIIFYRARMHLSISHIAKLVERSTRTVMKLLGKNCYIHKLFDKRKNPDVMRKRGESWFRNCYAILSWFNSVWIDGSITDISLLDGHSLKGGWKPP